MDAYLSRLGVTLHQRGVDGPTIAILIGTVVSLELIVGVAAVAIIRRWKRARAASPVT
jgi:NADH:ubiquinone oxidoreductase subunit K